jgi:hypothetical protein
VRSTLSGKRWSRRRLKGVELSCMELALNLSAAALFLASNANVFINDCAWFSPLTVWLGFASWTVWNSLFLLYIVQAGNMMPICQGAPRGALVAVLPLPASARACISVRLRVQPCARPTVYAQAESAQASAWGSTGQTPS